MRVCSQAYYPKNNVNSFWIRIYSTLLNKYLIVISYKILIAKLLYLQEGQKTFSVDPI